MSWMDFVPFLRVGNWLYGQLTQKQAKEEAKQQHKEDLEWQSNEAQKNRDFQTSEREAVQEFDVDMWNANNEYNSPASQLSRLQQAGINPNAMFGHSSPANISTSSPSSTPMSGNMASAVSSLAPMLLTSDAQVKNLMSQTLLNNTSAKLNDYTLSWNKLSEPQRLEALERANEKYSAEVHKLLSSAGLDNVKADVERGMFEWYSKLSEEDLKIKQEQLNLMRNQSLEILKDLTYKDVLIANTKMDTLSKQQGIYESTSRISVNDAQSALYESQSSLVDSQKELTDTDKAIKDVMKAFSQTTGIPIGTDLHSTLFYLWKEGRMWDYYNLLSTHGLQSFAGSVKLPSFGGNNSVPPYGYTTPKNSGYINP